LSATSAAAVGQTLAFGPTATSATIVNVDTILHANTAALAYGFKVTGASGADPMYLSVTEAPTNSAMFVQRVAANGAPAAIAGTNVVNGADAAVTVTAGAAGATSLTLTWIRE